jgi:hypothetical protein
MALKYGPAIGFFGSVVGIYGNVELALVIAYLLRQNRRALWIQSLQNPINKIN